MIFCRIEYGDYDPHVGEGLTAEMAFNNAKSSAEFEVTSECNITFWEDNKPNIQVRFGPTFNYI